MFCSWHGLELDNDDDDDNENVLGNGGTDEGNSLVHSHRRSRECDVTSIFLYLNENKKKLFVFSPTLKYDDRIVMSCT